MSNTDNRAERLRWFREAKFGMFVHWGCYAVLGHGEQAMVRDMIPADEYEKLADDFHPAEDWAEQLVAAAVDAGARYMVLTTRHHDGYCLWDTKTHDFNAAKTGPGRDLVAEYVEAVRAAGLKVGFYHSVHTWRRHGFWDPKKYAGELPQIVDEFHTQVEELMTNYGKIDILWYDVPAVPGSRVPGAFGWAGERIEQSAAEFYRSEEINSRARELQPHIIINNRSGVPEDFGTPEQHVTPEDDPERAWESCMTLNFAPGWGYIAHPVANKTPGEVVWHMVDAVRLGGNLLLNVGPDPRGYLSERDGSMLRDLGRWLDRNGEAIFGTKPGAIYKTPRQGPCFHYGMFTTRDSTAYLTVFYYPGNDIVLSQVGPDVKSATLLTTGRTLGVEPLSNARWRITGLPENPPDPIATVVKIEFSAPPYALRFDDASWLDGDYAPGTASSAAAR
jgi:alpha-L-fucosidase